MKPIKYMAHPVSPEDKAKCLADGFRIVDIRFQPESEKQEKPKRKPRKKAE